MTRLAFALAFIGVLVGPALAAPKYSGTIVAIDAAGKSITLNELGAGTPGGRNQEIQRVIALSPETRFVLAVRAADSDETEWRGGYKESPIPLKDVKPGDYATIEAETRDGRLIALSVVVVRPTTESR